MKDHHSTKFNVVPTNFTLDTKAYYYHQGLYKHPLQPLVSQNKQIQ